MAKDLLAAQPSIIIYYPASDTCNRKRAHNRNANNLDGPRRYRPHDFSNP